MPLQWHGDFRRNSVYKERQFQVVWAYVTAPFQWIWPESRRSAIRVDAAAVTGRPLPSATSDRLQVGVAVTGFATLRAVAGGLDPYCGATRLWPKPLKKWPLHTPKLLEIVALCTRSFVENGRATVVACGLDFNEL